MKLSENSWLGLSAVAALSALFLLLPEPQPLANSFVLGPVQVFDGGQRLPQPQYIEVRQGLIHSISAQRPDTDAPYTDSKNPDGSPQWLIPGLIDAHVHSWGNARQQQLSFGVTSAVDLFSAAAQLNQLKTSRDDIRQAQQSDLWSAGTLVTAPKGHGTEYGLQIPVLHSPAEAEAFVAARKAEGADFIKIVYQSERAIYKSMPSISKESLQAVIAAAHRHQLKAVVHIAEQASAIDAVAAGADGLVHSFFDAKISTALLQALKKQDVFVIPTLTVYEAAVRGISAQQLLLGHSTLDLPAAARAALSTNRNPRIPAALYQNLIDNTRAMHQAGIRLLAGTDAPNAGTYHGLSMVLEIALLQEAGLSLFEALHAATAAPARAFALPQRGQIAPGNRADFLLLPRLQQSTDLLSARVYKNGQLVTLSRNPPKRPAVHAGALADFSHSDQPLQGAAFAASSDQMMQGKSSASLTLQPHNSPASLQVSGKLVPGAAYPWAGVAWSAAADYQQGLDFSAVSTLQFQVRGSTGTYRLLAFSEGNQRPAELNFNVSTEWQQVRIQFSQLTGIDPSRISMLVWTASPTPQAHEFVLELANLSLSGNSGQ
jgi:imidazolonepropionase-like amidohydrolase